VAWRLEDGRAVLVAYDIYRQGNRYGQPLGVPGRGEFGMEILIALAYQVYTLGLFVTTGGVVGNNNVSERELRDDAQRRDTGRTNKTPTGAKRQSIIASVLRTLGKQLSKFTLASGLAEIQRWAERGRSCFTDQAKAAGLNRAPPDAEQPSLLDRIILDVDNPELAAA